MNQRPPGYEPDELPAALLRDVIKFGAENRGRTGTILLSGDFKSPASANSAIPAVFGQVPLNARARHMASLGIWLRRSGSNRQPTG